eukprot:g52417.t1
MLYSNFTIYAFSPFSAAFRSISHESMNELTRGASKIVYLRFIGTFLMLETPHIKKGEGYSIVTKDTLSLSRHGNRRLLGAPFSTLSQKGEMTRVHATLCPIAYRSRVFGPPEYSLSKGMSISKEETSKESCSEKASKDLRLIERNVKALCQKLFESEKAKRELEFKTVQLESEAKARDASREQWQVLLADVTKTASISQKQNNDMTTKMVTLQKVSDDTAKRLQEKEAAFLQMESELKIFKQEASKLEGVVEELRLTEETRDQLKAELLKKDEEHSDALATLQDSYDKTLLELVNQHRRQTENLKAKLAALKECSPSRGDGSGGKEEEGTTCYDLTTSSPHRSEKSKSGPPVKKSKKRRPRDDGFELTFAEPRPSDKGFKLGGSRHKQARQSPKKRRM